MSILSFFSSKKNGEKTNSQESKEYLLKVCSEYVSALSKVAINDGYLKAVSFVPELMEIGEDAVSLILSDGLLKMKWEGNNVFYYNVVLQLSFRAGILLSEKWHTDSDNLTIDYFRNRSDFMEYTDKLANEVLKLQINTDCPDCTKLIDRLFDCWIRKTDPTFALDNRSDNYIKASMLAVYTIAVSMMLEKYGYDSGIH